MAGWPRSIGDRCALTKVDLKRVLFNFVIDEASLEQAELMDGKLLLMTNVADLTPPEMVQRCKVFLALIVYLVMRQRLKQAKSDLSPKKALAELRKIQRHWVRINKAAPISGISTINNA